ncbi:hypothetical protein DY000_02049215 [Brassica cretica]|uniref:Uncharacterized protein n=1 Tax=Brassica cretica TaxID=69181 RepID=A0ABQ7EWE1_BRACR|nr:hypothetical protein DY000_02049215 [Brassica cretica]
MVSQGPYSASLGETTTGTCWDFAFYRSEAGHYRVLVLHAASAEATIRLIKVLLVWMKIQVPDFTTLHVWSSSRVLHNLVPLLGDPRLSLLIMAPGRVPSVGLVPGRQVGVSSDDEPGGCAQCREGSSFHRLGDSPSGIEYSKWDPLLIAIFFGTLGALEIFCPGIMDDPASRCVPLLWKGQGVVGDLGFLGLEDRFSEWSLTGKMRYLNLLLGTPYLAGVFGVPRYLTTCGDDTRGPSPSPS